MTSSASRALASLNRQLKPSHVVTPTAALSDPQRNREIFWKAYNAWLAQASWEEVEQMEAALVTHAANVRPVHVAIAAALKDPTTALQIPLTLAVALDQAGWQTEQVLPAAVAA
jgi:hypothetical protein